MTERERLEELLCSAPLGSKTFEQQYYKSTITKIADYLLANGVIVPPHEEAEKALHKINHNSLCETETYEIKQ